MAHDPNTNTLTRNANGQLDIFKLFMGAITSISTAGILYACVSFVEFKVAIAEINRDILSFNLSLTEFKVTTLREQAAEAARQDASIQRALEWNARLSSRLSTLEADTRP